MCYLYHSSRRDSRRVGFKPFFSLCALFAVSSFSTLSFAASSDQVDENEKTLTPVIVTAAPMSDPLTVVTDAKAPRQPVPAHDGADYLKTIPGFSVIRKAGTDGDPVFRGMAGSRLNILSDGDMVFGGCGGRMDPPTAYIFPAAYDRITVLKGPQSVIWGPASAGTVLFERDFKPYQTPDVHLYGSAMFGSYGRNDQAIDTQAGNASGYARLIATRSEMNDYEDGNGQSVHSLYKRWNVGAAVGLTPDENTRIELSATRSNGHAAYADRMMDGVKFERDGVNLKFEKAKISSVVEKVEAQIYYNTIDHVMDNYTLRDLPPSGSMGGMAAKSVNNPDRQTMGLRVSGNLNVTETSLLTVGIDQQGNRHRLRTSGNQDADPYQNKVRMGDATFADYGLFSEWTQMLSEADRLIGGLRGDFWQAEDKRKGFSTSGQTRRDTLPSGFVRYEHDFDKNATLFVGLGHSERFPDYWELVSQNKQSVTGDSAFNTRPEKNTQLDVGATYRIAADVQLSVSAFYSRMRDYILIDTTAKKNMMGPPITVTRNIDATTYGGEAGVTYAFLPNWKGGVSLAYVRGSNDTDHTPLAQMPPLDSRFTLDYDDGAWSAGALLRLAAAQHRIDPGKGNIAGQDLGTPAAGFGVFSINGGYRFRKDWRLTAGIDNLFDKTYAEAISKSGFMVPGYDQTTRINEPGRFFWLMLDARF